MVLLTDRNVEHINDLIQLAGCPMCLPALGDHWHRARAVIGEPLKDGQCGVGKVIYPNTIQCTANKYHVCSVRVENAHEVCIVTVFDVLEMPVEIPTCENPTSTTVS
jgi:hypothetical protein